MANRSKAKGTQYESALRDYLTLAGLKTERLPLSGNKDVGDLRMIDFPHVTVEAKNCAAMDLSTWMDEAATEARNAGNPVAVVMHKRRRRGVGESYVSMSLQDFVYFLTRNISAPR